DKYWLLEIDLITGRHHQIRAQLAHMGCPVKGYLKYGARRSNPGGGIHLFSRKTEFRHPFTGETVSVTADPPKDPLWDCFSEKENRDCLVFSHLPSFTPFARVFHPGFFFAAARTAVLNWGLEL
ncbi:MAG: hypothetical protein JEY99_21880, partial [Spirochaetales bacterium]|nr:hypothetical protein [Spirochaetales bacterium]